VFFYVLPRVGNPVFVLSAQKTKEATKKADIVK
jgi:hypothetical protein